MTVSTGFGLTATITSGSGGAAMVEIVKIVDLEFPKFKKFLTDVTTHDSPQGYTEMLDTGQRELQSFKMTLEWDSTVMSHTAIVTHFNGTTSVTMTVEDPGGVEIISFSCFIEEIQRISKQKEALQAEVLVTPTSYPTIT